MYEGRKEGKGGEGGLMKVSNSVRAGGRGRLMNKGEPLEMDEKSKNCKGL